MLEKYFGLIEVGLFFTLVGVFCIWQMWSLKRDIAARKEREKRPEAEQK